MVEAPRSQAPGFMAPQDASDPLREGAEAPARAFGQ
jgi:hypothetical protein